MATIASSVIYGNYSDPVCLVMATIAFQLSIATIAFPFIYGATVYLWRHRLFMASPFVRGNYGVWLGLGQIVRLLLTRSIITEILVD